MWGLSILILWLITGDLRVSVVPALMISFGDGITGVVRNYLFGRRTKHWIGNLAMLAVCVPLGYLYGGFIGALVGVVSSIVERLEYKWIDDNIVIPTVGTFIISFIISVYYLL